MPGVTACEACGRQTCPYENEDEPCYGAIRAIDTTEYEGRGYIGTRVDHACEGHKLAGMYVEEPDGD